MPTPRRRFDPDRRDTIKLLAGAAAAGIAGPALARLASQPDESSGSEETLIAWEQIRDEVWVTSPEAQGGNVLMLHDQGETLIIDSKFPQLAWALRADAESVAPGEIHYILTHHHADHSGGNIAFVNDTKQSIGHQNVAPRIAEQLDRYKQTAENGLNALIRAGAGNELVKTAKKAQEEARNWEVEDFTPKRLVERGGRIRVGRKGIAIGHFGPGHTDNDIAVQCLSDNVIHTGDLVFNGFHPFVDRAAGASLYGWIAVLARLRELADDDTIVVPGHGIVGDQRLLRNQQLYIERLIQAVAFDISEGIAKARMQQKTYGFMEGLSFDNLRPIAIGAAYDEIMDRRERGLPVGLEDA
ncbi:MAG: MBL fold metallo-hydrolase [Planctomycetota bacterium]